MSIVIPASQLRHTVITVRCENSRAAPQIECAFDDQLPPGLSSHSDKGASFTFSSEGKITPNISAPSTSSSLSDGEISRRDLSIERGQDQRGHFVRLSFSPPPRPGMTTIGGVEPGLGSSISAGSDRQSTPRQDTPMQSTMPKYGSYELANIQQIANDSYPQIRPEDALGFQLSSEELMSAFETSLEGFDYSQNCFDYLTTPMDPSLFDPSLGAMGGLIPETPELSSASSISSVMSSPPTPFDFGLGSSSAGSSRSGSGGSISSLQNSPPTSVEPSPMFAVNSLPRQQQFQQHNQPILPHPNSSQLHQTILPQPSTSESRLLPCPHPGCKRQFKNTSTLTGHLKTHAGKGTRFSCSFPPCPEKFSRRHDQLRHEVYKHGKRCEWVCPQCNSFFSYERSLEKHQCTMDKSRRGSVPFAEGTAAAS